MYGQDDGEWWVRGGRHEDDLTLMVTTEQDHHVVVGEIFGLNVDMWNAIQVERFLSIRRSGKAVLESPAERDQSTFAPGYAEREINSAEDVLNAFALAGGDMPPLLLWWDRTSLAEVWKNEMKLRWIDA